MKTTDDSAEFRSVHCAESALKCYINSNKNINVIKNIPINNIDRYDVWLTVFSKEHEAYRELEIKEWYSLLDDYRSASEGVKKYASVLCITLLTQTVEWDSPLKINDEISIILDIIGDNFLPVLIEKAEEHYNRRLEIVKPYHNPDNEWVSHSKKVFDALKSRVN